MDVTSNPALLIFASISPLLISFVKQQGWPTQVNALIALACYVVIGILGALLSGEDLTIENAVTLITIVTVVGSTAYQLVWTNLGGGDDTGSVEERLTAATSFIRA